MANQYTVTMSDGKKFDVTTSEHHDDHSDASFKNHLWAVITGSISGMISGTVIHFVFKGRR